MSQAQPTNVTLIMCEYQIIIAKQILEFRFLSSKIVTYLRLGEGSCHSEEKEHAEGNKDQNCFICAPQAANATLSQER